MKHGHSIFSHFIIFWPIFAFAFRNQKRLPWPLQIQKKFQSMNSIQESFSFAEVKGLRRYASLHCIRHEYSHGGNPSFWVRIKYGFEGTETTNFTQRFHFTIISDSLRPTNDAEKMNVFLSGAGLFLLSFWLKEDDAHFPLPFLRIVQCNNPK